MAVRGKRHDNAHRLDCYRQNQFGSGHCRQRVCGQVFRLLSARASLAMRASRHSSKVVSQKLRQNHQVLNVFQRKTPRRRFPFFTGRRLVIMDLQSAQSEISCFLSSQRPYSKRKAHLPTSLRSERPVICAFPSSLNYFSFPPFIRIQTTPIPKPTYSLLAIPKRRQLVTSNQQLPPSLPPLPIHLPNLQRPPKPKNSL